MSESTLVFFTYANPPTAAQVTMVEHFTTQYERIFVVPYVENMGGKSEDYQLAADQHRVNMARLAFEALSDSHKANVIVRECTDEGPRGGTMLSLVNAMQQDDNSLSSAALLMGSDVWTEFQEQNLVIQSKKEDSRFIKRTCKCVQVVARDGHAKSDMLLEAVQNDPENQNCSNTGVIVPHFLHYLPGLSKVRSTTAAGSKYAAELLDLLPRDVFRSVDQQDLYEFGKYRPPSMREDIPEVPRNTSHDNVRDVFDEGKMQAPASTLDTLTPLLRDAMTEMLEEGVKDEEAMPWLANYLKSHNPAKPLSYDGE
jgi:nicotinic acid mononucleotide adenylyltransferase